MDVIDTPRFNNDVDFLYRLATVLEMRLRKGMHMAKEQYQQNSKKWQTWQLGFQTLERYWANFQVTRLFHSATNFFNQVLITRMKRVFFLFFFGGGDCSAPVYLLFGAVYRSQGRRGYLDVSNVTLVLFLLKVVFCKSHCLNPHCQSVTVKTFGLLSLNLACFSWF